MQTAQQLNEAPLVLDCNHCGVIFCSEDDIAASIGANEWVMPCGHDCCTCDRECK